jgi:putative DNA primase/helicase
MRGDAMSNLLDHMAQAGLTPHKALDLNPDGRIHRYRVAGDKAGSTNGWYVLREQGRDQFATFGSWKTNQQHHWQSRHTAVMSKAEREELKRAKAEALQLAQAEQAAVQQAAREKASRLWQLARPAPDSHPYLQRKGIRGFGARQLGEALLIPARDAEGRLWTVQFVYPDGSKRFLTGGRIRGCYASIGRPGGVLLLAEGFATAATLYEATGHATAACFSAGNLANVARTLRAKFPSMKIVIAGDNDHQTPGNPGRTAALAAARAVGAVAVVPDFEGVRRG